MYGEEAPLERREEATAALSFFSGHTAVAFSVATGMFNLFRRRYGSSPITWIWLGLSTVAASMVALGRVMGGDHFPTDVIAGAAVGTAAGFIVPVFHASPEWGIQPVASHSTLGFKLSWM